MDALVLENGRVHYSCWTRPLKSMDASTEVAGRVQSELRLRLSKIWTRLAFAVDALGILEKRVQTRLHCVQ